MDGVATQLVLRCQRELPGDTSAFEALVALYKDRIYARIYYLIGNRQDAEDICQDVFLKIYRGIRRLDDPAMFAPWAYRIATNACYDALAKRKRQPAMMSLEPYDQDAGDEPRSVHAETADPQDVALQRELRRCLEQTLAQIDLTGREVLVLRDIEDRSYQEIADVLAIGLSAVKMRIHRARLAFQQMLERVCPGLYRSVARP